MGSSPLLRRSLVAGLAVAAAWAAPLGAATLADLYSVTVAPDPAAADQREAALQAAMARLLIRVTGSRNAPLEPALRPLLTTPDRYLSSYGDDRQGRALVGFSRGQVERALTEPATPALAWPGGGLTYGDLYARVCDAAARLEYRGVSGRVASF